MYKFLLLKLVSDVFHENLNKANIMHTFMGTAVFHLQTDYKRFVTKMSI